MKPINIIGPLYDFTADEILRQINETPKDEPIEFFIHSPGGSVYSAYALFAAIQQRGNAEDTAVIAGIAFSAASWVALAPDNLVVYPYSEFFVHRAMLIGCLGGNADFWSDFGKNEVKTIVADLQAMDKQLAGIYANRLGKSTSEMAQMLKDEKRLIGKEILDAGIATEMRKLTRRTKKTAAASGAKNLHGLPTYNLNEYEFAACSAWNCDDGAAVDIQNFPADDAFRVATRKALGLNLDPDESQADAQVDDRAAQVINLESELATTRANLEARDRKIATLTNLVNTLLT